MITTIPATPIPVLRMQSALHTMMPPAAVVLNLTSVIRTAPAVDPSVFTTLSVPRPWLALSNIVAILAQEPAVPTPSVRW